MQNLYKPWKIHIFFFFFCNCILFSIEIEKARESDRKDLQISMDGKEKTWISEKKKLQERNKKVNVHVQIEWKISNALSS